MTGRQKRGHSEGPLAAFEGGSTPVCAPCWSQAEDKGPSSVAHTASLVKSKKDKGKERIMGSKYKKVSTGRENFSLPVNTKRSKGSVLVLTEYS